MLPPLNALPFCSGLQKHAAPLKIQTQGGKSCLAPLSCIFARFAMPTSSFVLSWQVKNGPQNSGFANALSICMCSASDHGCCSDLGWPMQKAACTQACNFIGMGAEKHHGCCTCCCPYCHCHPSSCSCWGGWATTAAASSSVSSSSAL